MKSQIYKKFTLDNKVLLNKESLDYLSHQNVDFDKIISHCKQNNVTLLTIPLIQQLESKRLTDTFLIKKITKKLKNEPKKFETLKMDGTFGIFYKNYLNELVLESLEPIRLNINLTADIFLFEGMYFGVEGVLKEGTLNVNNILLPEIKLDFQNNDYLIKKNTRVVFFYEYKNSESEICYLKEILKNQNPDLFVFLGGISPSIIEDSKQIHINDDLPREIECYFGKLAVINSEIFSYKNIGTFLSNNYLKSFINTYLSQRSYNPFGWFDFDYEKVPNLIVIGQQGASSITLCEQVKVVSIGSFSKSFTYLVCDTNEWKVELEICLGY